MATMTVSLPDPMQEWIEAQVRRGEYASVSDYLADLVRRDREGRVGELSPQELRRKLEASRASGVSSRSVNDIFAEAQRIAAARG